MNLAKVTTAALAAGLVVGTGALARRLLPGRLEPIVEQRHDAVSDPAPWEPPTGGTLLDITTVTTAVTTPKGERRALLSSPVEGEGPRPGLVMLAGAGGDTAEMMLDWAQALAARGIVCLTLDKPRSYRNVIRSFEDLADDAAAAVDHLRAVPGVNPDHVVVGGLSEGSWIAAMAATRAPRAAGVVMLSAPTVGPGEEALWVGDHGLSRSAPPGARKALAHALAMPMPGMRWVRHDSVTTLREVSQPMLAVYGLRDKTLPLADGATLVTTTGENRSVLMLPGLRHTLDPGDDPAGEVVAAVAEFVHALPEVSTGVRGSAPKDMTPAMWLPQVQRWQTAVLFAATAAVVGGRAVVRQLGESRGPGETQAHRLAEVSGVTVLGNHLGLAGLMATGALRTGPLTLLPWVYLKALALRHSWTMADAVVSSGGRPRSKRSAAAWLAGLGGLAGIALTGATAEVW